MGIVTWLSVLCSLLLIQMSAAEHILKHSELPEYSENHPETFSVDLGLKDEIADLEDISLSLKKSRAVPLRVPLYGLDENGECNRNDLIHFKDVTFYNDLTNHAAISLINVDGESYAMRGSFVANNEMYEVEPYHPNIHKRSLGAKKGDHIIKKRELQDGPGDIDYIIPVELNPDKLSFEEWKTLNKKEKVKASKNNVEGQSIPHYTVTVYVVIDFYLYQEFVTSYARVQGPGSNVMEYIGYFIGQQINEISIRYECIDTSVVSGVSDWTMSVSFVGLYVEDSELNTWTSDATTYQDSEDALIALTNWTQKMTGGAGDVAHYMLITGLNIAFGGSAGNIGVAYLNSACRYYRCSVNEFYFNTALYAHELGHSVGSSHDTTPACSDGKQYVMDTPLTITSSSNRGNSWRFSNCSVQQIDDYINDLNSNGDNCYLTSMTPESILDTPLGQGLSLDEQCKLAYGTKYEYYNVRFGSVCYQMWCQQIGTSYRRATFPAAAFTSCGPDKWCDKKECVDVPSAATASTTTASTTAPGCVDKKPTKCIAINKKCDPVTNENWKSCRKQCSRKKEFCQCTCCKLGLLKSADC